MARSCAVCGKTSMGIFNPQSSGMNRVRTHRRAEPNLHRFKLVKGGKAVNTLICTRCRRTLTRTA
jgi:large subunit ribosomal protein L28